MSLVREHAPTLGVAPLCAALGLPRATYYRAIRPASPTPRTPRQRPSPPRTLPPDERAAVLDILHEERFADRAPAEVAATLLDEGVYVCSARTMYRILAANAEVRERRAQRRHPPREIPRLVAAGPNQVWSWDITRLRADHGWLYLYVILDVFSRYVVGWLLATAESAALAQRLIHETAERQNIAANALTLHADLGAPMTARPVVQLLADLGIVRSHSRPRVSNDNAFSEAQFKTLKYCPDFPGRFAGLDDARAFCTSFFDWYNHDHRHSGVAMLTPAVVHQGEATDVLAARQRVLDAAHARNPQRFVHGPPTHASLPASVGINQPTPGQVAVVASASDANQEG